MSAFSNAEGGAILIVVDDDGRVPGVIVGKKTLEDFAHRIQSSIDPKIQPSIRVVARWGTGTLRMAEALKTSGHPAPEFDNSGSHRFKVIFRKEFTEESLIGLALTDRQVATVLHLKKEGRLTNQEYQSMFGISKRTASRELTGAFREINYSASWENRKRHLLLIAIMSPFCLHLVPLANRLAS